MWDRLLSGRGTELRIAVGFLLIHPLSLVIVSFLLAPPAAKKAAAVVEEGAEQLKSLVITGGAVFGIPLAVSLPYYAPILLRSGARKSGHGGAERRLLALQSRSSPIPDVCRYEDDSNGRHGGR